MGRYVTEGKWQQGSTEWESRCIVALHGFINHLPIVSQLLGVLISWWWLRVHDTKKGFSSYHMSCFRHWCSAGAQPLSGYLLSYNHHIMVHTYVYMLVLSHELRRALVWYYGTSDQCPPSLTHHVVERMLVPTVLIITVSSCIIDCSKLKERVFNI